MLQIKYNGVRFPRVIGLRNHQKTSFLNERRILNLPDYDAYLLLRNNVRLTPTLWEFNVEKIIVVPSKQEVSSKDQGVLKNKKKKENTLK